MFESLPDQPLSDSTLILSSQRQAAVTAPPDWVHCLVVVEGHGLGQRLVISPQALTIGRRPGVGWLVPDPEVSGLHLTVRGDPREADLMVTDENSSNGSFIDGQRISGTVRLPRGSLLEFGRQVLRHDHLPRRELEAADELQRDLEKARRYVESLLPPPLSQGPLQVQWLFQPCQQLGGDAFGYQRLNDGRFAVYLVDVCGHGTGAAMHSVTILNVLRQHALPDTDLGQPAQVLERLNTMFQMDAHAGMYFSIWYGVFDPATRQLRYASGGHHAALLQLPGLAASRPLRTRNPVIGASAGRAFAQAETDVPAGARLHVFSDGLFEVVGSDGRAWAFDDLRTLLEAQPPGQPPHELFAAVQRAAQPGPLQDDASIVAVTFL